MKVRKVEGRKGKDRDIGDGECVAENGIGVKGMEKKKMREN